MTILHNNFSLEGAAEADCLAIGPRGNNVRFGSKADMCAAISNVRFAPESGHVRCTQRCPLRANSGLMHRSKQHRYSITSSASATSVLGTARSMDLAIFMLITNK